MAVERRTGARLLREAGDPADATSPTLPTVLDIGQIPDGGYLRRDGTEVRGDAVLVYTAGNFNDTTGTLANITGLSAAALNGESYAYRAGLIFRSASTGVGVRLGLTCPAGVVSARVSIPVGTAGTAAAYDGWITASGGSVTGSGTPAAATEYVAILEGILQPTANGTLQLQFATGTAATNVSLRVGSWMTITRL